MGNGKSPFNVMICPYTDHDKLSLEDLAKEMEKYLRGFSAKKMLAVMPKTISLIAHASQCKQCESNIADCRCQGPPSLSSPMDADAETPNFNTCTGDLVEVEPEDTVDEIQEESIFVMQILNISGEDVLTFFDRGANQHLIDGATAERLNLKVVDPRNTPLNVVGGGRIWTEYGLYAVRLGPTPKGKFHELRCQGINRITSSYPKYDLGPINKSVLKTGKIRHVSLPEYIGGSQVRLLIGIKDTAIDPINLFTLPCGLGVYKSQFKDKFKSRICYGGPSHLFSKVNREVNGTSQSFSIFFSQIASSYRNSLYPALARLPLDLEDDADLPISYPKESRNIYEIPACHELNISVHPSPVTAQDIKIFNPQYILKDESVEEAPSMSLNPPREIFDDSVGVHFCSVYKAKVPLSKLIRVIDEDDISSLVNYRCPSCSKCLKCLQSNRTKTMSLQEAAEQELIARSVTIDTDQKKVFVEFPFLKDPVAFLRTFHRDSANNRYQALRAYQAQCRKPQRIKEGIKKAHRELVDRGFIVKLTSLTQEQQELIKNSGFQHYFPWSSVEKESVSTPVRV